MKYYFLIMTALILTGCSTRNPPTVYEAQVQCIQYGVNPADENFASCVERIHQQALNHHHTGM